MSKNVQDIVAAAMNRKLPEFASGDTVVVQVKVQEVDRARVQAY